MKQINIFVSYSHKDAIWINVAESGSNISDSFSLIPWLAANLRRDEAMVWYDHALKQLPGEEYKKKIKSEIVSAQIAILLISQDFANSDFISDYELPWIKERVESNEMIIIPILVGPTDFGAEIHLKWVSERQMLPGKPTPLIRYTNSPADFQEVRLEILQAIRYRIRQLRDKNPDTGDKIDETTPTPTPNTTPATTPTTKPKPKPDVSGSLNKLKNGYYFIMQEEEPYYMKYRDQELPIIFQPFKSQNNRANMWYLQAEKMFYNLKTEEAARFYNRTIEEDPKFLEAYLKEALMSWLHPTLNKNDDAINYCIRGFESDNKHIIGSFLIYLYLNNNKTEDAKSILDKLFNSKIIENKGQLAGLYLLQSRLFNMCKDYDQEFENVKTANQISPFFGPALRQLSRIYLRENEFDKAEALLKNAFKEYSKHIYCRNWLDTRDSLVNIYGQAGMNERLFELLSENCSVQKVLNIEERFPSVKSNIFFEGEIDGNTCKGYLVNGIGFGFNKALLQDGFEKGNNVLCELNVNDSPEFCVFYDLQFGGAIVKIDIISYLMKIVQNNHTGCLIQTNNGFKLTGVKDAFPNLWFVNTDSSIQPLNLSLSNSFNLKRI